MVNSKTLSYRYTLNWICAVPCDGRDDLCEGYADELACNSVTISFIWGFLSVLGLSVLVTSYFCSLCPIRYKPWNEENEKRLNPSKLGCTLIGYNHMEKVDSEYYLNDLRTNPDYGLALQNMV